ncbi:hypothetical protein BDW72DRAFT_20313 [Aspergillus terricola var. indicus]
MDDPLIVAPNNSIFYASPASFCPMSNHPVRVPDEYFSYGTSSQLDPTGSCYPAPQPQPQGYVHQTPYYPTTTLSQTPNGSNAQWLHPSQAASHPQPQTYQDSIPSPDIDPDFDFDLDLDQGSFSSPSPSYRHIQYQTSRSDPSHNRNHSQNRSLSPSRTPSTTSTSSTHNNTNSKDLSLYGIPSPTHPGAWRCAYPACSSPSLFRRGCDLRKHYNRHRKHLFCRHDGCPQSNPQTPGAGFSSKKDRDRHEAKHNPGIVCEWASEGCTRVFSRVDNMKDHVRRIHKGV